MKMFHAITRDAAPNVSTSSGSAMSSVFVTGVLLCPPWSEYGPSEYSWNQVGGLGRAEKRLAEAGILDGNTSQRARPTGHNLQGRYDGAWGACLFEVSRITPNMAYLLNTHKWFTDCTDSPGRTSECGEVFGSGCVNCASTNTDGIGSSARYTRQVGPSETATTVQMYKPERLRSRRGYRWCTTR